ncbi:aspartic peptidase domain-containing protein [Suillus paluster]|uniref:aspartic peptidase domain-containing protein n=1 Tax=Suillus paluster TaxID=48578 RepID=UPI001B87FB7D|nr:aspartic peptidase domain-containing protein [Suillus paluster]KAG1731659.1 aspartic peptidase domain-containing protein [Suillus paluster]
MKLPAICALFVVAVVGSPTPPSSARSNIGRTQRILLNTAGSNSKAVDAERQLDYVSEKYAATMRAYERNTGSPHPLSSHFNVRPVAKRATNGSVPLTNYNADLWYGSIEVGTPPKQFTVLPSVKCTATCDGHKKYDPAVSSLAKDSGEPFILVYGSGETVGEEYSDVVSIGGYRANNQTLGAASAYSPAFSEISEFQGSPLVETLSESGQLPQSVLGFKLSTTTGDSEILIGGTNTNLYRSDTLTYIPVTKRGYWQVELSSISRSGQKINRSHSVPAIIDTRTTLVIMSDSVAQRYYANISGAIPHPVGAYTYWTIPCNSMDSAVPTFTFGGRTFTVSAQTFNLGPDTNSSDCMAGIASSSALSAYSLFFNRVNRTLDESSVAELSPNAVKELVKNKADTDLKEICIGS